MEKENQIAENEQTQTETEQEEQISNDSQEDNEEISDDEQLEIAQEIESYEHKISALDEKIAEYRTQDINKRKRKAMEKAHFTNEQIERYIRHIQGTSADEIKQSVDELASDITPAGDNFGDPGAFNPAATKPATTDHGEVGKNVFKRIKDKIRWGF